MKRGVVEMVFGDRPEYVIPMGSRVRVGFGGVEMWGELTGIMEGFTVGGLSQGVVYGVTPDGGKIPDWVPWWYVRAVVPLSYPN
jgi:hypothetical protein